MGYFTGKTIIITGAGGAGKDTLCAIAARHYAVTSVSAVDRIKEIARFGGWDGVKDERGRKLLSDIKLAFIAYNDLPFASLMEAYRAFCASQARVLFIHCREPKEIAKLQAAIPGSLSLLVRRPGAQSHFGNASDDEVENYRYDYIYENSQPLERAEADFLPLLRTMVGE
mgnify:FL=1